MMWQDFTTGDGVTVQPFAPHLHTRDSVSAKGGCAHGGRYLPLQGVVQRH